MEYYGLLFNLVFVFYLSSAVCFIFFFVTQKKTAGILGFYSAVSGFILHSLSLGIRSISLGYLSASNLYESLSFFSWMIVLVYLLSENRRRSWVNGAFILPLAVLLLGYALALNDKLKPLPPALQSPWLSIHAALCFLGYACFLIAFCLGLMYLWQEKELKSRKLDAFFFRLPALELMDHLAARAISLGFISLTLGIISGSLWAEKAWGAYWSWDPKETWSLITWLVYALYLHGRFIAGWQGRKSAYLAIIGFLCVLFTYFGVSFLLSGLHSYF